MIPYGHSIVGKVYYNFDIEGPSFGCTQGDLPLITDPPKVDASPIVMIDRGGCSFVTKVRNVERNGGHVALIINNSTEENISSIVMADNGKGMEVTIPGVIISKRDGDTIKEYMKQNLDNKGKQPIFEVEFRMENKTNVVQYDLWYTPDQIEVYKLLGDFYVYQAALKEHATLNIHLVTYTHYEYDPLKEKKAYKDCLSSGKYCIRQSSIRNIEGHEILKEGVRQKCIYNYAYSKGEFELFWHYMQNFYIDCYLSSIFSTECSLLTLKNSKISINEISSCYADSFELEGNERIKDYEALYPNTILANEVKQKKEWYISNIPSLFVNKRQFLSSWRGEYLFEAICAGLLKKPEYCFIDGYFSKERGYSTGSIIGIIVLIIAINAVIFYFCIRYIRRMVEDQLHTSKLKFQVNETVENYLRMRESN